MASVASVTSVADTIVGVRDSVFLLNLFGSDKAGDVIDVGNLVAERNAAFFTADLLGTYKILKNDPRELDRLLLRCGGDWGVTAYALALQAAVRKSMDAVLMVYDREGRDWEQAAARLGALYTSGAGLEPTYSFGLYLGRQQRVWRRLLL